MIPSIIHLRYSRQSIFILCMLVYPVDSSLMLKNMHNALEWGEIGCDLEGSIHSARNCWKREPPVES